MAQSKTIKAQRSGRRSRAVTSDVLGPNTELDTIPSKWRGHYDRLIRMLNSLARQKDKFVRDAQTDSPNYSLHMGDAGTDEYDRNLALTMASSDQNAVYEIEEALVRIRNGTYGICELTGKPIEAERLKAVPFTRFSAQAERQLEKQRVVKQTRLAERERVPKTTAKEAEEEEMED